jgi:hypothetical protein
LHNIHSFSRTLPYALRVEAFTSPACSDTGTEPNNSLAEAVPLPGAVVEGVACDGADQDFYSFATGASGVVTLSLAMPPGVDLNLQLLNTHGDVLFSSATTRHPEVLTTLELPPAEYVVQVQPFTVNNLAYPAAYTLTVTAPGLMVPGPGSSSGPGSSVGASSTSGTASLGSSAAPASSSGGSSSSGI